MWSKLDSVETIQIVLDKKLLRATDQAARQTKRNRSALVRDALREHLRALDTRAREERDRQVIQRGPRQPTKRMFGRRRRCGGTVTRGDVRLYQVQLIVGGFSDPEG